MARAGPRPRPGRPARRAARGHHAGLRRPGGQARSAHPRGGLRLGVKRGRHDRGRAPGVRARAPGRRAGLDRRRPLRRARADQRPRGRRRRADLLAVQVLRPAPRPGLRAGRGDRALAALQGPPGAGHPARAAVRDRHPALRAAGRVQRRHRLPGLHRRLRRDRALRAGARRAVPEQHPRRGHRVRAAGDGRPGADVPGQRRRRRPRRTSPSGWPPPTSGSGRTTRGTRSTCTSASATTTSPCGSASSTTTPPTRSTGSCRPWPPPRRP